MRGPGESKFTVAIWCVAIVYPVYADTHAHASPSGGGVGGLTCAVALARYPDIHVDVYESASEFAEVGAGIGMWPRTWKIMQALGLHRDLAKITDISPEEQLKAAFTFRKGDQPEGLSFYTFRTPGGLIPFHRPDFQAVLLRHLSPSTRTYTCKRLVSYDQPSRPGAPLILYFADGTTATADVLVGADGVKSAVRRTAMRELAQGKSNAEAAQLLSAAEPRWSGTCAYRTTIPTELIKARLPGHRVLRESLIYFGQDTQFTIYPVARGTLINLAAFRARYELEDTTVDGAWVEDVPRAEFLDDFPQLEPEMRALLQLVERPSRWAVHTTAPLPSFVSGRVALLGDAAHAMMPYQGSGAGQAIEDAYVLAALLGHAGTRAQTLPRALAAYDAVRRPCAQRVARGSRENGLLFTLNFPGLAGGLAEAAKRVRRNWEWAWETTVDGDVERAVGMLEGG
ncbi:FAD/NAD(P)-binding domain-containing protein [Sparassis latifolia]